jgi:EAL domain-containing protein (putative c-di-GMP-specific phosphodiesterase class I)
MDGPVLLRHLAQRKFTGGVVLLSGVDEEILSSAAGLARAHGLDVLGVLGKPSSLRQLQDLLECLSPPALPARARHLDESLSFESLTAALNNKEFVPWYQPKLDIRDQSVNSAEALARWRNAAGVMIGPGQFIPAMEACELVDALFFAMASQVAADLVAWRNQGLTLKVAINMSMDTAHNLEVPERLFDIINSAGLQPSDLIIEVTESRLMVERSLAMETLTRLSMMGFMLSIDDFGTGYSSLVQLIDLPFRELKIDGGFVRRAGDERKAQAILRISVQIGLNLGMDVIAEGVETDAQLEFVRNSGGHIVQGYKIARPMPFADCTQWLTQTRKP